MGFIVILVGNNMNTNNSNFKNLSEKENNSQEISQDSFFSEKGILNTPQNSNRKKLQKTTEQKRWDIIKWIKDNPNNTCYGIAKGTDTNYSQMYQIIRELLFARLILKTKITGENGEIYSAYYIPKDLEVKNE